MDLQFDEQAQFYLKAIEHSFLIVDKKAKTVPFVLNEPQRKILSSLSQRDIILKARQEGISALILALFTVDFLTVENVRCVVISHESGATQKLFDRVKFYLDSIKQTYPGGELPFKLKYNSRNELMNLEKNSVFYIGTAGSRAFGHGDTIHNLHISELSRWPNQEKLMIGLMQAVPRNGRVVIETTANGVGDYFYNLWRKSQSPSSPFRPHFLPWFILSEYSMPIKGEFKLTDEETELQTAYNLTAEQLNWRRYKIEELGGNLEAFQEQFPSNANEAFIVSGNPIWPASTLKFYERHCEPATKVGNLFGGYQVSFEANSKGNLKIWKEPTPSHSYVIGADISEGIEVQPDDPKRDNRQDFSSLTVMDRNTAEIVATWHGRMDPDQMGRQLDALGRYYFDAVIGVEKNNHGLMTLIVLRDLNYPRIYYREKEGLSSVRTTDEMGWRTDRFTRPLMIDETSKWLRERRLSIYDEELVGEMMSFVRYPDGQGRAAQNSFDDRVISMMICIQMYIRNPMTEQGNQISQPDSIVTGMENDIMDDFGGMDFGG